MKKVWAILFAAIMVLSMSVSVFATDLADTEISGDKDNDVIVEVKDKNGNTLTGEKVYKVVIEWKDMTFTFKADQTADEIEWDPDTHTYTNLTGKWMVGTTETNAIADAVKLINHSNAEVTYGFSFENAPDATAPKHSKLTGNVTAVLTGADGTLATAEGTEYDAAPFATSGVEVDNTAVPNLLSTFTVDTVIVSLTK
jgi:hypothetical protein